MKVSEYIYKIIKNEGRSRKWVAEQCNINYKTFIDKITFNRFSAEELIIISKVLNINLEKLKEEVELK